ncbi:hypothetical protein AGMMS49579_00970 [Spirochaetia bacterium]|nr:hypothetical protein AGMMS49579_00970 [Spirochaetia bacterium]
MNFTRPIAYLEPSDFTVSGQLKNSILKQGTVVIMIQKPDCIFCKEAKPAYQAAANILKDKVFFTTLECSNIGSEYLASKIKPDFSGYPDYVKFKNGKRSYEVLNGRNVSSLISWAQN